MLVYLKVKICVFPAPGALILTNEFEHYSGIYQFIWKEILNQHIKRCVCLKLVSYKLQVFLCNLPWYLSSSFLIHSSSFLHAFLCTCATSLCFSYMKRLCTSDEKLFCRHMSL